MNALKLNAIKERTEKATLGKWEVCNGTDVFTTLGATNKDGITANENDGWYISRCNEGSTSVGDEEIELSFAESNANAKFIAHAREDIPALVAEVERLNNVNKNLWHALISACSSLSADISDYYEEDSE